MIEKQLRHMQENMQKLLIKIIHFMESQITKEIVPILHHSVYMQVE